MIRVFRSSFGISNVRWLMAIGVCVISRRKLVVFVTPTSAIVRRRPTRLSAYTPEPRSRLAL
jgi:hypothetical protein